MTVFCDSPYFLLKDFMYQLVNPIVPSPLDVGVIDGWTQTKFTDVIYISSSQDFVFSSPYTNVPSLYPSATDIQIFEHDDVTWNCYIDRSPLYVYSGTPVVMRGMEKTIVVDGGSYIDVYLKMEDYGFKPIRLKPYGEPEEKQYFKFDTVDVVRLIAGSDVVYNSDVPVDEPYYDSDYITYKSYDYVLENLFVNSDEIENGLEVYFRKDGSFHDWLKIRAERYYKDTEEVDFIVRNYVNTDRMFLYFGKIYLISDIDPKNRYNIVFEGLKDWIRNALPVNNRKPMLMEFTDTYFDMVYSEGYQLLKNIWTLRDAVECDAKFLGYIPTFYGWWNYDKINEFFSPIYREFAENLVNLVKRKGTYSSIHIIYEVLSKNSPNILRILERWHDSSINGIVSKDQWTDHIYTGLYGQEEPTGIPGAGEFWYSHYDTANYPDGYNGNMMSPFYRVDLDLNVQPISPTRIMPRTVADNLDFSWERMRPVNRQSDHNFIYAPWCYLDGREYTLYEYPYGAHSVTKATDNIVFDDDNFIFIQKDPSEVWRVEHPLATENVIVTVYEVNTESDFRLKVPSEIKVITDGYIEIVFPTNTIGIVMITRALSSSVLSTTIKTLDGIQYYRIRHGMNREELLFQVRNNEEVSLVEHVNDSYVQDVNTFYYQKLPHESTVYIKKGLNVNDMLNDVSVVDTWHFPNGATLITDTNDPDYGWWVWDIYHPYEGNAVMANCYNSMNIRVEPEDINFGAVDNDGISFLRIRWAEQSTTPNGLSFSGFAAITEVGDLVSFYGIIPVDMSGNVLNAEWRLTVETETDIYTSLFEGSMDAAHLEKLGKTVHYGRYIYGDTGEGYQDDLNYYYTFTVRKESLLQLGIRDYNILGVEIVNPRIKRVNRQRIVYSRVSGIYKPLNINFVCQYKLIKEVVDPIMDTLFIGLEDVLQDYLTE